MAEEPIVRLLDTNTANQIAAGEVVEKPASVVKELVENALDADANRIEVTIYAGGKEYIRVTDNGYGMSEANARLAVLRHATSKIRKAEDLLGLHTLGFRGEALPSIASVSNFQLVTRTQNEEFATSVRIDGGEKMEVSTAGGSKGTTVIVENLFFNVPARRKFLKTIGTEGRYISELLTKLALSRPDVTFKLISNDKEVLSTPGDGDLKNTIRALYGKNVVQELLDVQFANQAVRISGFIGRPTLLKGTRQWQTLFVNGRSISNKMLAKAIDHAYQSQIPKSGFPFAVLNIDVPTTFVDVNVHPQKIEVKFTDDSLVYRTMYKALTNALTRPMSAKKNTVTLLPDSELQAFVLKQPSVSEKAVPKVTSYETVYKASGLEQIFKKPATAENDLENNAPETSSSVEKTLVPEQVNIWQLPREHILTMTEGEDSDKGLPETEEKVNLVHEEPGVGKSSCDSLVEREVISFTDTDNGIASIWPIGQVDKTFIIAQSEDTLYLIDQHAAHERIIYDKLVAANENIPSQQLLIPLYINLPADDIALLENKREEFLRLGVDSAAAGENMLRVSSLPADIKAEDAEDFIREIVKMLSEMKKINASDLRQEILHMTACKAAIKSGQLLNMRQMRQLIVDLCNTTHPFTCPHGRPCMIAFDRDKLDKMFKRTGF